jgi:hypothetical protein
MQHAQSRFLKAAVVSRFLAEHPKVSRFIANHLPALCPFLPLPTGVQSTRPGAVIPQPPAPRPRASRFVP